MHSWHGKKHNFHFDAGFDGEIYIVDKETSTELKMDAEELLQFISENYLRSKRISEIESMDWRELLK